MSVLDFAPIGVLVYYFFRYFTTIYKINNSAGLLFSSVATALLLYMGPKLLLYLAFSPRTFLVEGFTVAVAFAIACAGCLYLESRGGVK